MWWRSAAVALAAVAVGCGGSGLADRSPEALPSPTADPAPPVLAPRAGDVHPTGLRIPSIGVSTTVTDLGLQPDGTVEVPDDPAQVGWYEPGPDPGEPGSAAVLGHVDSRTGPAVFHRLGDLRAGQRVEVVRVDRSVAVFTVRAVRTYPNADFPATRVYRSTGRRSLTLVTCGGAYDRDRGGYQANVVVFAELTGITPGPVG